MRRFIAFLVLSISIILGIAFNAGTVLKNTNAGVDYDAGREFVYRVTDPEDEDALLQERDILKVKDTLEARLEDAGVKRYKLQVEGNDQIRVIVGQTTSTQYAYINQLMSFNAKFELSTTDDVDFAMEDEIFNKSTARLAFKSGSEDNVLPYVAIKISDKNKLKNLKDAALAITPESSSEEETSTNDANMLILWADRAEGETYEFANSDKEGADKVLEKVFMKFDPNNLYFDEDSQSEIAVRINGQDSNENQVLDNNEVKAAVDLAKHYVNLFNAGELDYDVKYLFDAPTSSLVENFINYGTIATIASSRTFIALMIGLAILAVFVCYFYRLGGVATMVSVLTTLFFSFMLFNAVGLEFNIAAIVGFVLVIIASTLGSIIYHEKLKEEIYRGRNMKKANGEAIKKTFLRILDVNAVLLIVSGLTYFLGKGMLDSFAIVGVVGSLVSFLVNITIYRLLMWLLTNNTSFQQKQNLLGVKKDLIPNVLQEEKQTYFGPFANRDFTKDTKKKNIIISAVTAGCAVIMLILGLVNGTAMARSHDKDTTRVYYEIHQYSDKVDTFSVDYLKTTFTGADIKISNIEKYESTDDNDESIFYYVIDLKKIMTGEEAIEGSTLEEFVGSLISDSDTKDVYAIRQVRTFGDQPVIGNVILALSISSLVAIVYIAIRYGIARAVGSLVVTIGATFLSLAFMSITRIPVIAPTIISIFFTAVVSMFITMLLAQKSKELIKESKEDLTIESANIKALGIAAGPIAILGLIGAYLSIDLLGFGPAAYSTLFCASLIGVGVTLILTLYTYTPIVNWLMHVIKPINHHKKNIKSGDDKTGNLKANKSAEPEESVFIGIND